MISLATIIVNWNGKKNTAECIQSIYDGSYPTAIIVVDNASTDGSYEFLGKTFPDIHVIQMDKNTGFTGGNNAGIQYALERKFTHIFLLNNDTLLAKNSILSIHNIIADDRERYIFSPKIYFAKGFEFYKQRYSEKDQGHVFWYAGGHLDWHNVIAEHRGVNEIDIHQFDSATTTDFATGCAMVIHNKVFREIGFFDERYYLYYEDLDFNVRAHKQGIHAWYCPEAFLWHKNAGSSHSGSLLHDYYLSRNKLLFGMKYAPWRTRLSLINESLRLIKNGRTWQKRGVFDYYTHNFYQGSFKTA